MFQRIKFIKCAVSCASALLLWAAVPVFSQVMTVRPEAHHDVSPAVRDLPTVSGLLAIEHEAEPARGIPLPLGLKPPTAPDPVLQQSAAPSALAPATSLNFDGIGQGVFGFNVGVAPPDTNGAVGLTQYVQWVNLSFAVFNKANGALLNGPTAGNSLWTGFGGGCESNNSGDPIVTYDKLANRWVLSQFAVATTPMLQCVAVSTTSDATGTYNRYSFPYSNFDDYPKMGVWPDAYYVTFNMFSGNTFVGADACAYDRNAMLNGLAATQICFQQGPTVGGLLPSDADGTTPPPAGSPNYMLFFGSNALNLFKFHVNFATPSASTFTGPTSIPVAAFTALCNGGRGCVPQAGTTTRLDSLADRLMYRLAYRNFSNHESLVVNHSVAVGASGGVRWYEIQNPNGAPVVAQQSTFAPDANFRWMGSIAMDKAGDIAVGYSVSSSGMNPAIAFTGHAVSDPANTMEAETTIINGTGSQTNGLTRWGDYSAMQVDPADDCTFWYTTEYLRATGSFNWNTRIASFKFPNCNSTPPPPPLNADTTVWRPANGTWFRQDANGAVVTQQWGLPGDIPVPGDYDGDGKPDFAVWRPDSGTWFIIRSSDGAVVTQQWGLSGDIPVPSDYDGDGKTDFAVWRPDNGTWFIIRSSDGVLVTQQWGLSGDIPVPGDYDRDHRADFAVWRPSNGIWFVIRSSDGAVVTQQWGLPGDIPVPGDYDRDGKTDFAVWRPGSGTWFVIRSSDGAVVTQQWGLPGDIPVPGDYDKDGKTDFAVWRPSNGIWFVIRSSNGTVGTRQWGLNGDIPINRPIGIAFPQLRRADFSVWRPSNGTWFVTSTSDGTVVSQQWGVAGDIPVPGDYDGDGKPDFAVWRPSSGTWFVIHSSDGSVATQQWGLNGDIPVPGDYDGDGKTDFAVWRPSNGTWFVIRTSDGSVVIQQWGLNGDIPAPGDYDGDGKTDFTVWRPGNGTWFVIRTSDGSVATQQWGLNGDNPVAGDYDGDGKADFAVWRPSNGTWFVIHSSDGSVASQQWGLNGDIPVPGDYDGDRRTDFAVWRPGSGTWFVIQSIDGGVITKQWGLNGDIPANKPIGQ